MNKEEIEQEIHEVEEIELPKTNNEKPKYEQTVQNENKIKEIVNKIIVVMEQDKLYQETELTLQTLSDKLHFPPYQVSQAINDGMNKNFYDLINSYRVEEAKRLLLDPKNKNYTILSVGFEAGSIPRSRLIRFLKSLPG